MSNPFDILGLSETWLNEDFSNHMISIDGYKIERNDRDATGGGGVGCYINEKFNYLRRTDLETKELELMWLEIKRTSSSSIFVVILYRKPSCPGKFFTVIEGNIEKVMSLSNNIVLLGDFNCNMRNDNTLSKNVKDICRICQRNPLINEPTRVSPHSSTLIDLILTSNYIANLRSGVMPIGFSDHCLIFC